MRTAAQEIARYNWITPRTFGERIGGEKPLSPDMVRKLIRTGQIRPDMVFVCNPGSKRPDYRINPAAVEAFASDHDMTNAA